MTWESCCKSCKDIPGPRCAFQRALSNDPVSLKCSHSCCSNTRQFAFQSMTRFLPSYQVQWLNLVSPFVDMSSAILQMYWPPCGTSYSILFCQVCFAFDLNLPCFPSDWRIPVGILELFLRSFHPVPSVEVPRPEQGNYPTGLEIRLILQDR